ncbi:MAG: thiamine phosphate synthase [Pseudomonadota bacterium]
MTLNFIGYRTRAANLNHIAEQVASNTKPSGPFDLAFFTDKRRIDRPDLVIRCLRKRSVVVYRDYTCPSRERHGRALRALCASRKIPFLVAGDEHLAKTLNADGVHWPSFLLSKAKTTVGITTAACHSLRELKAAEISGIDGVFLSPIFETQSHLNGQWLGVKKAATLAEKTSLPVYALGGINPNTAALLKNGGFSGIAAIGAFAP